MAVIMINSHRKSLDNITSNILIPHAFQNLHEANEIELVFCDISREDRNQVTSSSWFLNIHVCSIYKISLHWDIKIMVLK